MLRFIRKSTQRKFLVIMFAALIAVNGPLLVTFFVVTKETLESEMIAKKRILLDANSKALSKLLWDFDYDNLEKWTAAIASEPDIFSIQVLDDNNKSLALVSNAEPGEDPGESEEVLFSKEIAHTVEGVDHYVGTLQIRFRADQISSHAIEQVVYPVILFVVSTISVLIAALIANRFMIVGPLGRLNDAIEATNLSGTRTKVDWSSSDELGRVTSAFNDMQDSLDLDEAKLLKANKRLVFQYNNTPVMLYSIDRDDRIRKVSNYWLGATGYSREQVIGREFSEFIHPDVTAEYIAHRSLLLAGQNETLEFTSKFVQADGTHLDVLITEVKDFDVSSTGHRSLSVMTDISKLKAAEAELLRQARIDFLTGLLNREGFSERLDIAIHKAGLAKDVAVLFFDLDRFKWVNDNLGHFAGDEVLKSVTEQVSQMLDVDDCFGRIGGDEFAIILSCENSKSRSVELAKRINHSLKKPINISGRKLQISASIGISYFPDNAKTAEDLLQASDVAMYRQKNSGRNGHCVFDEKFGKEAARRLEVKEIIAEALKNDWFELHFQPIVELQGGSIVGFEGLLRLVHPSRGTLSPQEYIQVAEQTGGILEIGDRVFELGMRALQVLQAKPEWQAAYVALNVSAAQFLPELPVKLANKLSEHAIAPDRLVLEITETTLMQNTIGLDGLIDDIRNLGCAFALDDFGTGFSSLSYVHRFPVETVKIDRSFIKGLVDKTEIGQVGKTDALIEAIVGLSQKLSLNVIAEGIETEEQLQRLLKMGVDYGQGFLFGKAEPLEAILSRPEGRSRNIALPEVQFGKIQNL